MFLQYKENVMLYIVRWMHSDTIYCCSCYCNETTAYFVQKSKKDFYIYWFYTCRDWSQSTAS